MIMNIDEEDRIDREEVSTEWSLPSSYNHKLSTKEVGRAGLQLNFGHGRR